MYLKKNVAISVSLSRYVNYYLDFSRVASLIGTNHRYSNSELCARAFILLGIVTPMTLAYQSPEDHSKSFRTLNVLLHGTVGFILTHTIVILPLIMKRVKMSSEIQHLNNELSYFFNSRISDLNEKRFFTEHMDILKKWDASTKKSANSSMTLGRRLRLLKTYAELIKDSCPSKIDMDKLLREYK